MTDMADHEKDGSGQATNPPVILSFVSDLFFASKIEAAAKTVHMQVVWLEMGQDTFPSEGTPPAIHSAENTSGAGFVLLEKITRLQPALILFDLGDVKYPLAGVAAPNQIVAGDAAHPGHRLRGACRRRRT